MNICQKYRGVLEYETRCSTLSPKLLLDRPKYIPKQQHVSEQNNIHRNITANDATLHPLSVLSQDNVEYNGCVNMLLSGRCDNMNCGSSHTKEDLQNLCMVLLERLPKSKYNIKKRRVTIDDDSDAADPADPADPADVDAAAADSDDSEAADVADADADAADDDDSADSDAADDDSDAADDDSDAADDDSQAADVADDDSDAADDDSDAAGDDSQAADDAVNSPLTRSKKYKRVSSLKAKGFKQLRKNHSSDFYIQDEDIRPTIDESNILCEETWEHFKKLYEFGTKLLVVGGLHRAEVETLQSHFLLQIVEFR